MADGDSEQVRVGGLLLDLERLTYATVVVMSVLAAYKGWSELSFPAATAVVVAPVLAVAVAHCFAELMHAHAVNQRPLTKPEWRAAVAHQPHLLLAALPPFVVLTVGRLTPLEAQDARVVVLGTGLITLIGLATIASRRAGYHGWQLVVASLAGGLVGLIVISLQVLLKPK
jgi:hypothetical protein